MPASPKSSRNAERSSLFYVSRLKSVNRHGNRRGRDRETQNCRHFWPGLLSSRLKSVVTGIGGVVVAKRRTVVTFGLVSFLRV